LYKKNELGITLTELAITITIIGILISATLGGLTLLKTAKLRRITAEIIALKTATDQFVQEYNYLAGDLPNASNYFNGSNDGNGNQIIEYGQNDATPTDLEDLFFWEHLSNAEIIPGFFTGSVASEATIRYEIGKNIGGSVAYDNAGFMFSTTTTPLYGSIGHAIKYGALDTSGELKKGILSAKDAYSIDLKIDDGKLASGNLAAIKDIAASSTGCINSTTSPAQYALENAEKSCFLNYWYKKF
jgi:type II secretory pathway pseudopilin PulG